MSCTFHLADNSTKEPRARSSLNQPKGKSKATEYVIAGHKAKQKEYVGPSGLGVGANLTTNANNSSEKGRNGWSRGNCLHWCAFAPNSGPINHESFVLQANRERRIRLFKEGVAFTLE